MDGWRASNRSSQRSRAGSSGKSTISVLSPATVPTCSVRVDSSIAWPMTLAVPGWPVRTRIRPLRPTRHGDVGEDPPQPLVGRRTGARAERLRVHVDRVVAAHDLGQTELGDVAAHGRLGHVEAERRQLGDELALAADRALADEAPDRGMAVALGDDDGHHAAPARARAETRVPKVGSSRARARASGADESAMIASASSQASAASAARDLGHHAAADRAVGDEGLGLVGADRVELGAGGVAHAVDVGHQHELARAEAGGEPGRRVVGVHVAHDALLVAGERRHDRHLVGDEQRVEEVAPDADDRRDEPDVRQPLADEQAAVDARQPDRVAADVAQRGDELAS